MQLCMSVGMQACCSRRLLQCCIDMLEQKTAGHIPIMCVWQAFSSVGRCKTFDASADGYGRGEGCAAVVIKPEAADSPQPPLAILQGSLVNQDGRSSSLTAPNGPSQSALISSTMQAAGEPCLQA